MKPIRILITAIGYQGGYTLVQQLKKVKEREITIVGCDMNGKSAAKFYCDKFYKVSPAIDKKGYPVKRFVSDVKKISEKEKIDLILPASSYDTYALSSFRYSLGKCFSRKLLLSNFPIVRNCINKYHTYEVLEGKIDLPKYVYNHKGYFKKSLTGKGARDIEFIKGEEDNKRYLIMEKLEGENIDVDVLSLRGKLLLAICKTRERVYGGTLMEGEVVDRPEIIKQIKKILKYIPLSYLSVWQFIDGKLLEINPRIAGAIVYEKNWNIPYLTIKLGLGELKPRQIKKYQKRITYGKKIIRFMNQYD